MIPHPRRAAAIAGTAMLCVGVLYTGVATIRLYGQVFARPQVLEASALDAYLAPMRVRSAAAVRGALLAANWPADGNVLVVADPSLDRQTVYQTYYSTSYVLYPRRVWLVSACDRKTVDAAIARYDARYAVAIGRATIFPHAQRQTMSDMFSLVAFR